MEKNQRWQDFIQGATQTKFATAQTELAFLVPPRLRSKARYMNLASMLRWAEKVLAVLDDPSLVAPELCSAERLKEKFSWLLDFRADVQQWSDWLRITDAALDVVRRNGYCASTTDKVKQALDEVPKTAESELLKQELITIVQTESSKVQQGERMPGSTELLESSFGKLKEIEGDQTRSGFTSLILIWAALFGVTTSAVICDAMSCVSVKHVHAWTEEKLGSTVQSKRAKLAHALRKKTTEKPEEP